MEASDDERRALAADVAAVPAVRSFGNADVVGKPNRINFMGASSIAETLRAASILLKVDSAWDWFITLSASDYPLITQDGMPPYTKFQSHWLIYGRSIFLMGDLNYRMSSPSL